METILNLEYDFDWLQSKIVYDSPPTFRQLSTVRAAANLWYEEEKIELLEGIEGNADLREIQKKLLEKINKKALLLPLPKKLKNSVAQMIELTTQQLCEFFQLMPYKFFMQNRWPALKNAI